jgi:chromosome segregation ATPase
MQMLGLRANLDKHITQNNLNNMKLSRLSADLDNLVQTKDKLNNDLNTKSNILKLKEDENAKFRLENAKIIKSREILMKKLMTVEATKTGLDNEVIKLKNIIATSEKEREQTKRTIEQVKKYADSVIRDRDLVRKELVKCNSKYTYKNI